MKRKRGARPIAVVLGTRPEIIKLSPLIHLLQRKNRAYFLIHTGQHYSFDMDRVFFKQLRLPEPRYRLDCRSKSAEKQAEHVARIMTAIEEILLKEKPSYVVVQGDTNSVLAGSLAAAKIAGARLAHVEAGLRSYDRSMPEEVNRILSDHVSDVLFPPTRAAADTLKKEGIDPRKITVTGNTIVDAVRQNLGIVRRMKRKPSSGVSGRYLLMTLHRQESVDSEKRLRAIFKAVERVCAELNLTALFPAHPRTVKQLEVFGIPTPACVRPLTPQGFLEFVALEKGAALILTDSGGVQEEACILGVPCVTLRTTTERPETVRVGANVVAGYDPVRILAASRKMVRKSGKWPNPFGDGKASERILKILSRPDIAVLG